MKTLHKLTNILLIMGIALTTLCGCQIEDEKVEGQELVEKARESLANLNSGVITVTNTLTGDVEQMLTFRYDEVGIFTYTLEGEDYVQFCNGYEIYTLENGQTTKITKSDSDYQAYTFDVRYPMTDENYLYFSSDKIIDVKSEDGTYTYSYDVSVVSGDDGLGELKSFETKYAFDGDGELLWFEEISQYSLNDEVSDYCYKIQIRNQNSVELVEKPQVFKIEQ